jgi:hypothetical protein
MKNEKKREGKASMVKRRISYSNVIKYLLNPFGAKKI